MDNNEFMDFVRKRFERSIDMLREKNHDYGTFFDRFHTFNDGVKFGLEDNDTRESILWGIAIKHLSSVKKMVRGAKNGNYPTEYHIEEKIGDLINYFILLEAMLTERAQNRKSPRDITNE